MKIRDLELLKGREFALGDITDPKVKPLRNQHLLNSARNMINMK
jgi:hypothetical protein